MKALNVYRIAAVVLFVFCLMHTVGGMLSHQSHGMAADAVLEGMKAARFDVFGASCTFYGFYFGFGLITSVFLMLSSAMAWFLGGLPAPTLRAIAPLTWMLFASQIACAILSWAYFFPPPGVFAIVAAILTGVGALRSRSGSEGSLVAAA